MPARWQRLGDGAPEGAPSAPRLRLWLWPNRPLGARGFAAAVAFAAAALALPLLSMLGTPALWATLPFAVLAVALLWRALRASYAGASEVLTLAPDRIELVRRDPGRAPRRWSAAPHWVRLRLRPEGGPVENYLTLRGGGREVELGAFLSPEERAGLYAPLDEALRAAVSPAAP